MTGDEPNCSTAATFDSGSSSSSSASSLFNLDENDRSSILVYKYRMDKKALEVTSQHDLCKALDSDPNKLFYRVTRKPIPRGNSRVDVCGEDLMCPEDLKRYADKPTLKSSLANVGLPSRAYWKRLFFNSFPELFILSKSITPTSSPNSSQNNSPESSQHVSPATTFPVDTPHPLQDPQAS